MLDLPLPSPRALHFKKKKEETSPAAAAAAFVALPRRQCIIIQQQCGAVGHVVCEDAGMYAMINVFGVVGSRVMDHVGGGLAEWGGTSLLSTLLL